MIIWDTGEYEVLPYYADKSLPETDDSRSEDSDYARSPKDCASDSAKLQEAFQNVRIDSFLYAYSFLTLESAKNSAQTSRDPPAEGLHSHVAYG